MSLETVDSNSFISFEAFRFRSLYMSIVSFRQRRRDAVCRTRVSTDTSGCCRRIRWSDVSLLEKLDYRGRVQTSDNSSGPDPLSAISDDPRVPSLSRWPIFLRPPTPPASLQFYFPCRSNARWLVIRDDTKRQFCDSWLWNESRGFLVNREPGLLFLLLVVEIRDDVMEFISLVLADKKHNCLIRSIIFW